MTNASAVSEEDLIQKCKQGQLKFQEMLYKRFYGYAMGIGMRYMKNREDALEIVNDAFIKAFKALHQFTDGSSFKAWFRQIVVNTAIDRQRKNMRQLEVTDIETAYDIGQVADITANLHAKDTVQLFNYLPEMQRAIFNLYEVDGFSHEEIGLMLHIPTSTSRVYLSRAKESLKKLVYKYNLTGYERNV